MVFATAVAAAGQPGRGGGCGADGVSQGLSALRRHRHESGRGRLAQDRHDERLPQPPLALPCALAVLQRASDRADTRATSDDLAYEAGPLPCSTDSPALDLEQAEERERLEQALRRLPDHQRVPLVLFHFEDTSYQEIAVLLGVSLGKVKTDIHRGREALRKQLSTDHGSR